MSAPLAAIVDYGLGNLFSVKHALERSGLSVVITHEEEILSRADAIVLPGVGAFGDAMASLEELGLTEVLRSLAAGGRPFLGICLGLQLLMTRSSEFGWHDGLDIVKGDVRPLETPVEDGQRLKVPRVGWERVVPVANTASGWAETPLRCTPSGAYVYFVHSFRGLSGGLRCRIGGVPVRRQPLLLGSGV